jgi:cytochrome c oxidase accessory protein FixG
VDALTPPAPLYANRKRVYTKDVYGPVRSIKSAIMVACLAIYYTLPWLRWNRGPDAPDQALLLDLWHERFYFFNVVLWPQDIYLLTFLLILGAIALFLVTSLFGRVWCGYACPQTVWTDLFMTVERLIEGDRNTRMKRDAGPWTRDFVWRKAAKHWLWFWIAFWTGGAWTMYFVNAPVVVGEFWTGRASVDVYVMTILFTATTYLLAGWAREQVCTYMCPWPRFQAAMLDEQTITVTYDALRGEPRGHRRHNAEAKAGDCVDCFACVHVCPTGIDIRDGSQLECINCGLCVDACNHVMDKMGTQPFLIGWDTLADQKAKAAGGVAAWRLIRPRTLVYLAALLCAIGAVSFGLVHRSTTNFSAIHDRAPLFVRLKDGNIRNAYTLKLANKTQSPADYTLTVNDRPAFSLGLPEQGTDLSAHAQLHVAAGVVGTFRLIIQGPAPEGAARAPITLHLAKTEGTTAEQADYNTLFFSPETPEK